jgi:hypothetical protein
MSSDDSGIHGADATAKVVTKHPVESTPSVDSDPSVQSRVVREILNGGLESTRRDAIALVESLFKSANRAVPVECDCDADNRQCLCFEPGKTCCDQLVSEINKSETIRITNLVAATLRVVRPNGTIPHYQAIEDAIPVQAKPPIIRSSMPVR